ncbi:MAG TPA: protein-export chaperone SecB [Pyrinomonadaceae bacterium]|jgi:preprotein translocase subunit SecB|nr:protein-export chaperone SecB [Pyrinomonadaceae bacterium]
MRPSQLLLDNYYLDEFSFSLSDDYTFEPGVDEPKIGPEDLEVTVDTARHPEDPLQWMFKLAVSLKNKDNRFPFTFLIRLTGFFEVSKDCPTDLVDRLALVNAPSILYASAREILAVVSGRSRFLTLFLPSVSFFEPTKEAKAEVSSTDTKAEPVKARKKSARKVSRKK